MPRITIWIDEQEQAALLAAANAERRRPADQAAVLLSHALNAVTLQQATAVRQEVALNAVIE